MTGAVEIGIVQLVLATGFIVISAGLSLALSLGYCRSLIVATVRTYLQLWALGFVLRWVFRIDEAWLVIAILAVMMLMAVVTIQGRLKSAPRGIFPALLNAVFLSGVTVTFAVTALIVKVEPWYAARYVIPVGGMVIGNSMTGLALSLERVFGDMTKRNLEINTLLTLGATPLEAALPSIRTALRAGLIPTINAMSAVGIVFIPGMMTGQILAGSDPRTASAYQIVVMLMISAATTLGSVIAVLTSYRRAFDEEGRFILDGKD